MVAGDGRAIRACAEGRIGFKTKGGFFKWDDESVAKERARYERALRKRLEVFKEEGIV
jgi:3-hydroxybutyryl-CoA dehydrogenase